jgi:lysophospholipase L1-like esterase
MTSTHERNCIVNRSLRHPVLQNSLLAAALLLHGCGDDSKHAVDASVVSDTRLDVAAVELTDVAATPDARDAADAPDPFDPSLVDAGVGGAPPALTANVTIHIVGDSTAAIFPATDPRVGWGAVLGDYFGPGVTVHDAAKSGRSSKSFIDEGHWASVKTTIRPGDYVFIEFGHNDEKYGDDARYTIPNTSYRYYLKTYIAETRASGGFAVLLTSICRRQFSGTTVPDSHAACTAAVLAVGSETGTPVIDLQAKTNAWLTDLGPTASTAYFAPADGTHLNAAGAMAVAGMVVQGIRELAFPVAERIIEPLDGGLSGETGAQVDGGVDGPEQDGATPDGVMVAPPASVDSQPATDGGVGANHG